MKKRLLVLALSLIMLLQCACAAVSANVTEGKNELADNIISTKDAVQTNATSLDATINITSTERTYVRGGKWADMTRQEILKERGLADMVIIKHGFKPNYEYCRVALFRYDISDLEIDDIGYATMFASFTDIQPDKEVCFDFYLMDNNWDADTVTMNTLPKQLLDEPIITDCVFNGAGKSDVTNGLKLLVSAGYGEVTLMMVQTTDTANESRIAFAKSTDYTFPYFSIYKSDDIKDTGYIKQLVPDEAENKAIWDHAKQVYDEWYERYTILKDKPALDAELIVSDASQYNKVSKTTGTNPEDSWKEYKTRTYGDLTDMSRYVDVNAEVKLDKYGGIIDPMMRQKATGFFYSKKLGDRWWIIDPLGYPCHIRALSGVVYSYQGSPKQKDAAYKLFGTLDKWAIATTRHLMNDLYFNACAGPSDEIKTVLDGMIWQGGPTFIYNYGTMIGVNNSNGGSTTFSENNTMPVFDPEFETYADERAATLIPAYAELPNFLGYTTDNELPMQLKMLTDYLNVPPSNPVNRYSYACAWYWFVQMTGKESPTSDDVTDELKELFRGFVWDRYYSVVCSAIRKYDTNHMIMGTRFLTVVKDAPWVLRFASLHLDCITVNWYGQWEPSADDIYDFASNADIPFMVTEFYAKAEENEDNLANKDGAGFFVKTQQDRADHYQSFTLRLLEAKNCVGWHWFQYTDNDPTGNPTDTSSRDANKGIVSNTHKEYTDLTDDMMDINKNVYTLIKYFDAKYAK